MHPHHSIYQHRSIGTAAYLASSIDNTDEDLPVGRAKVEARRTKRWDDETGLQTTDHPLQCRLAFRVAQR